MIWPWTSAKALRASEERLHWTEQQLRAAEAKYALAEAARGRLEAAVTELETERKRLTDRILVMSGQKPLYEPEIVASVAAAAAPAHDPKDLAKADALPAAGITFHGVHKLAREAMRTHNFDVERARPRI